MMGQAMEFVHLHCHSAYSLGEGTARLGELVASAKAHKMTALALTDHNSMYGAVDFYLQARKAGIKPILGMEVSLDDGSRLVLLARNMDGYSNLCHLASALKLEVEVESFEPVGFEDGERIAPWDAEMSIAQVFGWGDNSPIITQRKKQATLPRSALLSGRHARGLVALSGGKEGRVNSLVMQGKLDKAAREVGMLVSAFGEGNVFIELTLHDENDRRAVPALVKLANDLSVPVVATNDVLYMEQKDEPLAQALAAARRGRAGPGKWMRDLDGLTDDGEKIESGERYFKSPEDMVELFQEYPQAIANTRYIAEQCTVELPVERAHFPSVELKNEETAFSKLWKLCFAGATRRYKPLTREVIARLKQELEVIETLEFSPYFLVVRDIANFALSRDIPIIARGSASNSLVAYVLGITQVDPMAHDLLFERFLNLSRAKFEMPDIDLDLCWRRRDEVLHYIYEKYGREHVATVGTHITFRLRSAWREMAKALGVTPERVNYVASKLPHMISVEEMLHDLNETPASEDILDPGDGTFAISDTSEAVEMNGKTPRLKDEVEARAFRYAQEIDRLPRHAGMHCAGIVITSQPAADLVPLQRAARDHSMAITQYDKDAIESLGLVKIDLLGSRALTTLVDSLQSSGMARGAGDAARALETIPLDDERTYRMLAEGETLGCFQLESPGMRGLLKWLRPRSLQEIAIAISLFRPGPLEGGFMEVFMRRRLGQEEVTYYHPSMEPILKETYGVILYQEQFLMLANRLAGMDMGEAEKLRKDLGKTKSAEERAKLGAWFVAGAIERGIPQLQTEKVWEIIAGYSGFGFCKAHACSYAVAAYRSAYMKAHYPEHYLAAQINNLGGYYGTTVYVEDARRLGIELLPPDVNRSGAWCEVPHKKRAIRMGLQFIKGLGTQSIEALLTERRANGPYRSLADLLARVQLKPNEQTALVKVGACDRLGADGWGEGEIGNVTHIAAKRELNRKQLMWMLPALQQVRRPLWGRSRAEKSSVEDVTAMQIAAGDFLYSASTPRVLGNRMLKLDIPKLDDYLPEEKLRMEREALGFALAGNEIGLYEETLQRLGAVPAGELTRYADKEAAVGGMIVAGRRHITKQGEWMLFFTLQTVEGLVEAVLFPEAYKRCAKVLMTCGNGPYLVKGKVQVTGKGRGLGVQPPAELPLPDMLTLKMHPVVIAEGMEGLTCSSQDLTSRIMSE